MAGADRGKFDFDITNGQLTFKAAPDYEKPGDANKDNVYEVTVEATDAVGNTGTKDVKVTVTNVNEDGTVTMSQRQPRVGVPITASLTDLDGDVSNVTWQWSRSQTQNGPFDDIDKATSATYKPAMADFDPNRMFLRATAMYTDGEDEEKTAMGESDNEVDEDTRNEPPAFDDQDEDTMGVQNDETTREVAENTAVSDDVSSPVTATDPAPNSDALVYTLEGADADSFTINSDGQIQVGDGTELDYEASKTSYMVTVKAEDSFGASASIMVTITVTDVDEAPEIMLGGLAISGSSSVQYAENGEGPVETYMVSGPDAASARWSLSGDDAGDFSISSAGVLTFKSAPDYEVPAAADRNNVYMVTVEANDGTYIDTHVVMVTVTNVDELGMVSGEATVEYAENGMDAMAAYTADGPVTAEWSLSGADAGVFDIGGGVLTFKVSPDFEMPRGMAVSSTNTNTYEVTVQANAGGEMGEVAVTVTVTNVDEPGVVTLWASATEALTMAPQVGDTITGAVMDPDGGVTGESWQWARTTAPAMMDSWMPITGATNAAYMVTEGDTGDYLRVMATYTDAVGTDTAMVYSPATMMVTAMMTVPMFESETATRVVAENTEAGMDIGDPVMGTDADGDTLIYTLGGTDAASFDIKADTGQLMTKEALDYETKDSYEVMVTATDPDSASDMITVTITVTNVEEPGMVTLWASATDALTMAPQVGETITGAVMDPDNPDDDATVESWQWARTTTPDMMDSWMPITGETNAAYMVTEGDTGYYLRVMATYTDAVGTDTAMVYSMPTMMVTAGDTLLEQV